MEKRVISRKREVPGATLHHLPCSIDFNGSVPVSSYFVVNDENKIKEAMFRGRLLRGERVQLPEQIEGFSLYKFTLIDRAFSCKEKGRK